MRLRQSTWAWPALIAVSALAGLIIGLVGDGPADVAGWCGLVPAVVAVIWAWRAARAPAQRPASAALRQQGRGESGNRRTTG